MLLVNGVMARPVVSGGALGEFERYLSLWVALCMIAGVVLGKLIPSAVAGLRGMSWWKYP